MKTFLPFSVPDIQDSEIEEVIKVLKSGWITTGPKVEEFENSFARFIGSRHAIAVNSGTAALHLASEAIGLREGDEVIMPPLTFAATAEVIRYLGAKPIFVDIEEETLNIDPIKIEEYLTTKNNPRIKAIMPVHFGGLPCHMEKILQSANTRNLRVIEDAAHAFPVNYKGRMIGTMSDVTCFSFYATKTITTGEGGMLTTDDDRIAERTRIMRLHGISRDAWKRYTKEGSWYYEIIAPGFKYNLTDIAAAIGLAQLKRACEMREKRRQIADLYNEAFKEISFVKPPFYANDHAWHLYVIRLDTKGLRIDRDRFIEELRARGIGTSVHFIPLHMHPYYRDMYGFEPMDYPVSFKAYKEIVSLPIYSRMSSEDVWGVTEKINEVIESNRR